MKRELICNNCGTLFDYDTERHVIERTNFSSLYGKETAKYTKCPNCEEEIEV